MLRRFALVSAAVFGIAGALTASCAESGECVGFECGRDAPEGDLPSAEASTPDGNEAGADAAGPTLKRLLDLCSADAECASGTCRPFSKGLASRCTKTCASNNDCMSGTRCTAVGTETYCVASDVGRPCSSATQCNQACLVAQQYCTATCTSGADCPNGYGCQEVGTPATKVCVKAAAPCGPSDTSACIAPAACDDSPALLVASCTLACNSAADCPVRAEGLPPWACDGNGICRRPGDVYGPLPTGARASYACNVAQVVVNVCNDGQHIDLASFSVPAPPPVDCNALVTTDGAAGDICIDSCRYRGGCTEGHACTAVGAVNGKRVGLCLPAFGSGEVGTPCTTDAACFFGYCNRNTSKCSRDCTADGLCPTGSTCVPGGGPDVEAQAFRRCE